MLAFTSFGIAQPKGNHRAFFRPGMKAPLITDSNRSAKSWAQLVAQDASRALAETQGATLELGPVKLTAIFFLPRPKKLQKAKHALADHTKKPDLDKLLRSILDALTGVLWLDDSQVVELSASKRYAELARPPHVSVWVEPLVAYALKEE